MFDAKRLSEGQRFGKKPARHARLGRRLKRRGRRGFEPLELRTMLATYIVDSLGDTNDGDHSAGKFTLREAVIQAADSPGVDTIEFIPTLTGTIVLLGNPINIVSDVTINGPGADQLAISGNNNTRVFKVFSFASAQISGLTIQNGRFADGGGILVEGVLTLGDSIIKSNVAAVSSGGAINVAAGAQLTIVDTSIFGNTAMLRGGGIHNDGILSVTRSAVTDNVAMTGGGVFSQGTSLTMANSTVSGNAAADLGGGLHFASAATLINVTATNNRTDIDGNDSGGGGGIFRAAGAVVLHNTIVAGNFKGTGTVSDDVVGTLDPASSSNLVGGDPLLAPLASHGGPTLTHALLAGSPAIDAGNNAFAASTDQRGVSRIQDGNGDGTATVDIGAYEFEQVNHAPVANAGGPYGIDLGGDLVLDASGSTDPDAAFGDAIVRYEWDLDLDGIYDIDTANDAVVVSAAQLQAIGIGVGPHTIELRVTDSHGLTSTSTAALNVYDNQPVAVLSINPGSAEPGQQVAFNASGSTHGQPDRNIVQFQFSFGDGQTYTETPSNAPDGAFDGMTTYTYSAAGSFSASVTVTDDNTPPKSATATANVEVIQVNHPPLANAGGPYSLAEGTSVTLAGSGSDPDGDAITFEWDLDYDGAAFDVDQTGSQPSIAFADDVALRTIALRVTDSLGESAIATTTLEVTNALPGIQSLRLVHPITDAPVTSVAEGAAVRLRGTVVDAGTADILMLRINWGDSITDVLTLAPGEAFSADHTYADAPAVPMNLMIHLLVADDDEGSSNASIPIQVTNAPPTIDSVTFTPSLPVEASKVELSAVASDGAGAEDALSFTWLITGPNGFSLSPVGSSPSFTPPDSGSYSAKLTVDDGDGGQDSDTVVINVANVGPTASFAPSSPFVNEGDPVQVSFSDAKDASSNDVAAGFTFSYDFDGDTLFEIIQAKASTQQIESKYFADGPGTATILGRIHDKDGGFAEYSANIRIDNVAPTVTSFSTPTTADEGQTATFAATASDPAGDLDTLDFVWTITRPDGSTGFALGPSPEFTFGRDGVYGVQLFVSDEDGGTSAPATAQIDVANLPPTAIPGGPYTGDEGGTMKLNGSASDPGGPDEPLALSWDLDGDDIFGETGVDALRGDETGPAPTFLAAGLPGGSTVPIFLRATDDDGASDTRSTIVTINLGNQPPLADAGGPYLIDAGADLLLDASGSIDPDAAAGDQIDLFQWDLNDDGAYDLSTANAVHLAGWNTLADLGVGVGTHPIRLRTTDTGGAASTDTATLTVFDNRPIAAFAASPNPAAPAQAVTFDATASTHGRPDRQIVSYHWDFDDGTTYTETALSAPDGAFDGRTTHAFGQFGVFDVALTITDDNSPALADGETLAVDVSLGNHPPIADAGGPYSTRVGEIVTLDASQSLDAEAAFGDAIVGYEWDMNNDGKFEGSIVDPAGLVITLAGAAPLDVQTSSPTFAYRNDNWQFGGSQTIRLRVTDRFGLHGEQATQIDIQANQPPVADAGGPYAIEAGADLLLDASQSIDPNAATGDSIAAYAWDLDNDGQFDVATPDAKHSLAWNSLRDLGIGTGAATTIRLRVTDSFGAFGDDETTLSITDTTPPETIIDKAPLALVNTRTAVFETSGVDLVTTDPRFEYRIGGGDFRRMSTHILTLVDLPDGEHKVEIRAVDEAGNADATPAARTFTVDASGPVVTIGRAPGSDANAHGWNNGNVTVTYTASDAGSGLESPATGSFTFDQEGDNQSHTFTVYDLAGNSTSVTIDGVRIDKTAPAAELLPASGSYLPGTSFNWTAGDSLASVAAVELIVNGSAQAVAANGTAMMTPGTQTISIAAIDRAGNTSTATRAYDVTGAAMVDGDLVVVGTEAADSIDIRAAGLGLHVVMNGISHGLFPASAGKVVAVGLGGDDTIRGETLLHPARYFGGDGNDTLVGGRSHDILLGGAGADVLAAGLGRDLLIGGLDADQLLGNGAILVGGTTAHDGDSEALESLLQTWSDPALSYAARVAALEAGIGHPPVRLHSQTVFADSAADTLVGRDQVDWFFAELGLDTRLSPRRPRPPVNPSR